MGRTLMLVAVLAWSAGAVAQDTGGWRVGQGDVDPMTDRAPRWVVTPLVEAEDGTAAAVVQIRCPEPNGTVYVLFRIVGVTPAVEHKEQQSPPSTMLRMRFDRGDVKVPHLQFLVDSKALVDSEARVHTVGVTLPGAGWVAELVAQTWRKFDPAKIPVLDDFLRGREVLVELMSDTRTKVYFRISLTGSRATYREACGDG